jgi:hypothetical protein
MSSRSGYKYEIKDNKLYLYCICDGTLSFLNQMYTLLAVYGFTDIECDGHMLVEGDKKIPEDRPWCDYEFICSGIFSNEELRSKFKSLCGYLQF